MKYALIVAAGNGHRMGNTNLPKQFLLLGSKPIIIHTIEQFLLNPNIDKILIGVSADWKNYFQDILNNYCPQTNKIDIYIGGENRNETIINGCNFIKNKYVIQDNDIIITHDAVRPFITSRIIDDNIEAVLKYDAVNTIIPANDTIVEANNENLITNIPIRNKMFLGQTPQSFKIKKLLNLYHNLSTEEKNILTDACKIFTLNNEKVYCVSGELFNFKITTIYDLKIAKAIIEGNIES